MTKTFHFIGEQTNMVHTLGTLCCYFEGQALACPIDKLKESRKTAGCRDLSWDAGSLVANPSSGATCQGADNRGGR